MLTNLGEGDVLLGDKAYDADWLRQRIEAQGAAPNISNKSNRKEKHCFSKTLYKERNLVERFFNRIKHFRRVATLPLCKVPNSLTHINIQTHASLAVLTSPFLLGTC